MTDNIARKIRTIDIDGENIFLSTAEGSYKWNHRWEEQDNEYWREDKQDHREDYFDRSF